MSGLFGAKAQSTIDDRLNAIAINQSAYGGAIALTYGKTRVPMTLGWYGAFTATPHSEKVGGKGGGGATHTSFTYSAAVVMLLGEGQVAGVGTVWADKAQVTLSDLGLTLFTGPGSQTTWSYLTTNYPSQAIPYDHTAYVANGAFQLGSSAGLPNLSFELKALLPYSAGTIDDAEPSAILIDYCTDANHGCGFNYLDSAINAAGTASYKAYCVAMGFFLSPSERSQRAAADFIREILTVTNSECVWSAGVLRVVPLADASASGNSRTYTPVLTPQYTFGDDDFLYEEGEGPVKVTRKAPAERFNIIRVEYLDRSNQYNTAIAEAKDANDIALNGERAAPTITLHCIVTTSVARQVAQIILQRQLYVVNSYAFKVRADYSLVEPLDYVALNDSVLGLSSKLVRITESEDSEDDEFSITAEEVLVGTAGAPVYDWQSAAGYAANYNASPGSIATPLIFSAPPLLVGTNGGYELWIAVSGAGSLWGGCDVYMSMDNASYTFVGKISGAARYGTLTSTLATGTDPDTTHTLAVQLADTDLSLVTGTAGDVANNRTLLYVDGEIMAYQTATLTGAGAYNLTTLRRGQYGSLPAAHSSGTKFARIDSALFRVPYDAGMVGQQAYFKFVSFNIYGGGYEQLASVSSYLKLLNSVNAGQVIQGSLTLIGRNAAVVGNLAFKSGGTSGAWDADCYSAQSYLNGAFVSFRPGDTSLTFMVGLNTDPTLDSGYTSLDFALFCDSGTLKVYESGVGIFSFSTYATSDDLSVTYDGAVVRYLQNGVVLREVIAGPGKRFYFDSSFYHSQATVTDIRFGPYGTAAPVLFNARGNCVVSDTNAGKIGGSAAWDSDVYSIRGYATCHVSFKPNDTTGRLIIGLGTAPLTDASYTSVGYGWLCNSGAALQIYESGSFIGSYGSFVATTVLAITYDGSTITYWKDGVSQRTLSVAGLTLYLDSSFEDPGAGVNSLRFGPTTNLAVVDTSQIGDGAATVTYIVEGDGSVATQAPNAGASYLINAAGNAIVNFTPEFDCIAIITCTGIVTAASYGGGAGSMTLAAGLATGSVGALAQMNGSFYPNVGQYAAQYEYNVLAGVSYYAGAAATVLTGSSVSIQQAVCQVELIKR